VLVYCVGPPKGKLCGHCGQLPLQDLPDWNWRCTVCGTVGLIGARRSTSTIGYAEFGAWNALVARIAAGSAKIILTDPGTASTPVSAAVPACPARNAIRATWTTRHGRQPAHISCSTKRAGAISDRGWGRAFDDPIAVRDGRKLVTLRDVATYITKLTKAEHAAPEWQAEIEALIMAAEDRGPLLHARVGVMRALNQQRKDHQK
jgi:hypothetical protein